MRLLGLDAIMLPEFFNEMSYAFRYTDTETTNMSDLPKRIESLEERLSNVSESASQRRRHGLAIGVVRNGAVSAAPRGADRRGGG